MLHLFDHISRQINMEEVKGLVIDCKNSEAGARPTAVTGVQGGWSPDGMLHFIFYSDRLKPAAMHQLKPIREEGQALEFPLSESVSQAIDKDGNLIMDRWVEASLVCSAQTLQRIIEFFKTNLAQLEQPPTNPPAQ